jgi:hypothetical protein
MGGDILVCTITYLLRSVNLNFIGCVACAAFMQELDAKTASNNALRQKVSQTKEKVKAAESGEPDFPIYLIPQDLFSSDRLSGECNAASLHFVVSYPMVYIISFVGL